MSFPLGSVIRRPLANVWGAVFSHMGIYVGRGEIIHFNGEEKKHCGAVLRRESLTTFAHGLPLTLHAAPRNAGHAAAVVCAAERQLADPHNSFNQRYSWWWNNCEDFCISCYEAGYAESFAPAT